MCNTAEAEWFVGFKNPTYHFCLLQTVAWALPTT